MKKANKEKNETLLLVIEFRRIFINVLLKY